LNVQAVHQWHEEWKMNTKTHNGIWLCDCGRIHVETAHSRLSFSPAEFVTLLRTAAANKGTEAATRLPAACYQQAAFRATQPATVASDFALMANTLVM
jgi:hypothetical protein